MSYDISCGAGICLYNIVICFKDSLIYDVYRCIVRILLVIYK